MLCSLAVARDGLAPSVSAKALLQLVVALRACAVGTDNLAFAGLVAAQKSANLLVPYNAS